MKSESEVLGEIQPQLHPTETSTTEDGIEERIREFVASNLLFSENGFPYQNSDSFLRHSVIDSLGVIELVTFVERQYHVAVQPAEVTPENFDSVNQLAAFVRRKIGGATEDLYAGS